MIASGTTQTGAAIKDPGRLTEVSETGSNRVVTLPSLTLNCGIPVGVYRMHARTLSINTPTTALSVRFLNVMIAIGHGRVGISTGSALREKRFSQDRIGKGGYVPTRGREVSAKVKRKRHNAHLWDRRSAGTMPLRGENYSRCLVASGPTCGRIGGVFGGAAKRVEPLLGGCFGGGVKLTIPSIVVSHCQVLS